MQVRGNNNDMNFDVDLVPSINLEYMALLSRGGSACTNIVDSTSLGKLNHHVSSLCRQFGCSICKNCGNSWESFMAISLHKADPDKFELDFHELERKILFNRGCVKKVIKLMKYLRDIKGGPMLKLWSHLIKVNMKTKTFFFFNRFLSDLCHASGFEAVRRLLAQLKPGGLLCGFPQQPLGRFKKKQNRRCLFSRGKTKEFHPKFQILFCQWNLLSRIKNFQVKKDSIKWLERALQRYHTSQRVINIFY